MFKTEGVLEIIYTGISLAVTPGFIGIIIGYVKRKALIRVSIVDLYFGINISYIKSSYLKNKYLD